LRRALRYCAVAAAAAVVLWIAGAASIVARAQSSTSNSAANPAGQSADRAAPRVVTDEMGRRVTLPSRVNRIVTLAPNLTEIVYALDAQDKLAGDTDYCDTPPAAKSKPHVGAILNPSLEAIAALHPDLVLATTSINRRETVDALTRLGIPVYTTDSPTVRAMLDSIEHIADLLGDPGRGLRETQLLQARLDSLHRRLEDRSPVHVFFVVWEEPLISIGQNTFIADALRWAGAESVITSDRNWPQISMEEVVRVQPDYIVFTSNHGAMQLADLRSRPAWRELRAVQLGHVVTISEEIQRPSPGLVDVIEQLARALHPDVFSRNVPRRDSPSTSLPAFIAASFHIVPCQEPSCAR
jgi:iron complex transport system substrate-binding protein